MEQVPAKASSEDRSSKSLSEKLRLVFERVLLPALTALIAYYLFHGVLSKFAEQLPAPYGEVVAHPIIDNILYGLFSLMYFVVGYITNRIGKWPFVGLLFFMAGEYALVRFLPAKRFVLYIDLVGLLLIPLWAAGVATVFTTKEVSRIPFDPIGNLIESSGQKNSQKSDSEGFVAFMAIFIWLVCCASYVVISVVCSVVLGIAAWDVLSLRIFVSLSVVAGSVIVLLGGLALIIWKCNFADEASSS